MRRDEIGIVVHRKNECDCTFYFYWFTSLVVYIVSILLVVSITAFLTRNIPNKSFTTKALSVLCYILVFLFFTGIPLYSFLAFIVFDPIYNFATLSLVINLMLVAFSMCIFVPPLLPIFRLYQRKAETKAKVLPMRKISQSSMQSNY